MNRPTIAIFVFDGAEELDWVGPWEVLAAWRDGWPDDAVTVFTIAQHAGVVTSAKGLRTLPDYNWDDTPPFDVLVYPGGRGTRSQMTDDRILDWVRRHAKDITLMTSVCTGSLVFAAAGLLDDGPATTHWGALDTLRDSGTNIEVREDDRFVDRGSIITAAGVSAGIDMALHLVARLHSPKRARDVRRYIQYDPEPPV
jgi:transcriptional regulator GlxA family with amidase domain